MIHIDEKTGREIEVFTTKEEAKEKYTGIEVTRNGNWVAEIGCWFDDKNRLVDYDGVMILKNDCIRALRVAGWIVPKDFENDNK